MFPAVANAILVRAPEVPASGAVLPHPAMRFLSELENRFGERRRELLDDRARRQDGLDAGEMPGFLAATESLRQTEWKVTPAPALLSDRRVEITGPVDRKMMINALNSGANVFMADFEDSLSPTWEALVQGQLNLMEAVAGTLTYEAVGGRPYLLNATTATLMVRPRGWHLDETHAELAGRPMSASLFDAGLFLFHCATPLHAAGKGPFLYLPKMESHLEARLWNDVLAFAEERLGLPPATTRVTVLVETIFAAYQMDEILHELSGRVCGLNAGRWDYLFSMIKAFQAHSDKVLPERGQITMDAPFMEAYANLLVETCHRRGVHAIGGMSAFVPSRKDADVNRIAITQVGQDKAREAAQGFDGTWVAHPDLVPVARKAFDDVLQGKANQLDLPLTNVVPDASALVDITIPGGRVTQAGLRDNLDVALRYLASWLSGTGALLLSNLMEDTATAEIARAQVWQWVRHAAPLAAGNTVTPELVRCMIDEELDAIRKEIGDDGVRRGHFLDARNLLMDLVADRALAPFLTVAAGEYLEPVAVAG